MAYLRHTAKSLFYFPQNAIIVIILSFYVQIILIYFAYATRFPFPVIGRHYNACTLIPKCIYIFINVIKHHSLSLPNETLQRDRRRQQE